MTSPAMVSSDTENKVQDRSLELSELWAAPAVGQSTRLVKSCMDFSATTDQELCEGKFLCIHGQGEISRAKLFAGGVSHVRRGQSRQEGSVTSEMQNSSLLHYRFTDSQSFTQVLINYLN